MSTDQNNQILVRLVTSIENLASLPKVQLPKRVANEVAMKATFNLAMSEDLKVNEAMSKLATVLEDIYGQLNANTISNR